MKIIVIDSQFPQAVPFGFRNIEINGILSKIENSQAYMMFPMLPSGKAWFKHGYGSKKEEFNKNLEGYLSYYSLQNKGRIKYLPEKINESCLVYSYFLSETYTLLPYLEENNLPFIFVLYPGGGFGLNNTSSDGMLKEVFESFCFRKVIVTQRVTLEYLKMKNLCPKERIEYLFGGYVQFKKSEVLYKKIYPKDKKTIDICFVAAKYSHNGVDKGYDLFIDTAKVICGKYPELRFHVVGGFDENEIDISGISEKITFYGYKSPSFLKEFYSKIDICLAPNRLYKLFEGNFDGFPQGIDSLCFGVLLMTCDELNNNAGFIDGKEIVIIKPELSSILHKIVPLLENTELLYQIGKDGKEKLFEILNPEKRIEKITEILKKEAQKIELEKMISIEQAIQIKPKVTIVCTSYNQEKFISQALESFVNQKANFSFVAIVADDCSTDKTYEIIKTYAEKYPDIIKPIFRKKNLGAMENFIETLSVVDSEYVIVNEGDDYFTNEYKLQRQVDFLKANLDCSICFHNVEVLVEGGKGTPSIFPSMKFRFNKTILGLNDLLVRNFIQTNSCMYRWRFGKEQNIKKFVSLNMLPGDHYIHLLHAQVGKIGFIDETMAVYRRHPDGLWFDSLVDFEKLFLTHGVKLLNFYYNVYKNIADESPEYFNGIFLPNFQKIFQTFRQHNKLEELVNHPALEEFIK